MIRRRLVLASAVAVVVTAGFLPGAGAASPVSAVRAPRTIPAGLAEAIHARFGLSQLRLAVDSPTEHPYFGGAVAMSADGTTALVSADGAGNLKGAAYIYHVADAGSWTSSATPTATLAGTAFHGLGEALGGSVALSADGTTAFVTAPLSFQDNGVGSVLVFHVADESAWASTSTPTATLTNSTGDLGDYFGWAGLAASSDGTTLVIGDWSYQSNRGGAFIFHVASESAWTSTATPTAALSNAAQPKSDSAAGEEVAMSGDGKTVLVSNILRSKATGGAYLFHAASEDAWATSSTPTASLTDANGVAHDVLGGSLALSGDGTTAFVAAPFANAHKGSVDVFHVADAGSWVTSSTPVATLTNGGGAAYDFFGDALAVPADGATVVVGAPGVVKRTGASYVFHASAEDAWASTSTPTAALTNSAGKHGDLRFEEAGVSADGATVLLGSPLVNWSTGTADVFHVADAGSWLTSSTPTATLTNSALPKPLCVVPNIRKYHVPFAKEILSEANCTLGTVKRIHSSRKHRGKILAQSPVPGTHRPPGSKVNVKVGK